MAAGAEEGAGRGAGARGAAAPAQQGLEEGAGARRKRPGEGGAGAAAESRAEAARAGDASVGDGAAGAQVEGGAAGAGVGGAAGIQGGLPGMPAGGQDARTAPPSGQGAEGGAGPIADAREQFRHVSLFWTDLIHLMASKPQALTSAGPMRNYAENAKAIATEMLAAGQDAAEFSEALSKYYDQLAATWAGAQRKVDAKLPRIPNDLERFEAYKRVWIDMFDNDFTELFDSKRFGDNYGRLVSKELDLARHWNNMMDVVLRSANLPNKKDIEGVYREMHSLKRRVSKLEAENRQLRAAAAAAAADGAGAAGGGAGGAGGA